MDKNLKDMTYSELLGYRLRIIFIINNSYQLGKFINNGISLTNFLSVKDYDLLQEVNEEIFKREKQTNFKEETLYKELNLLENKLIELELETSFVDKQRQKIKNLPHKLLIEEINEKFNFDINKNKMFYQGEENGKNYFSNKNDMVLNVFCENNKPYMIQLERV